MRTALRYLFGAAVTAIAAAATIHFAALLSPMRMLFLWTAVLLTAVVCGTGPALFSTAIATLYAAFNVFPPAGSLTLASRTDQFRVLLFAVFAGILSIAVGMRRTLQERARRLSASLRASELRYRTLVESSPVPQAIWMSTPEGRITWSPEWAKITGQTQEELESGAGMRVVHPEDAARTWGRWNEALAKGTIYEDEVRVRVAGGRTRWFALKASPVRDDDGTILEWVGLITDIHAKKQHEEAAAFVNRASELLNATLDSAEAMRRLARLCVPALGDWCAIHLARDGGYDRLVLEQADPMHDSAVESAVDVLASGAGPDGLAGVSAAGRPWLVESLDGRDGEATPETAQQEVLRRSGVRSWLVAPMTTRGRTVGTLMLVHAESGRNFSAEDLPLVEEVARRAAMALENARLYEAAEAANRAKDEFLATLSHELRTPLTAIAGWAHILQSGAADPGTSRLAIDTIVQSAKTQGELIDDLLDVARVMAGTFRLELGPVDLSRLAREVAVAARPAAEAKNLALELDAAAAVTVRGDERRLRQVIWNLLTNAIKFSTAGGAVKIRVAATPPMAMVVVTDNGCGIDPAFLPFVWDRFRQADSSASRQFGGLGLGLAVVRHLVELHGGTVFAQSEGRDRGAEFRVEIPLARASADLRAGAGTIERVSARAVGRRILVVDDDQDARRVLAAMLEQLGAAVTTSASPAEATRHLGEETYDLVLSDLAMPGEDGYAFARRLGASHEIPMIAVSAMGSADDRLKALEAGFADFVRKPVEPAELERALQTALRDR